jgi:hypothetical protein
MIVASSGAGSFFSVIIGIYIVGVIVAMVIFRVDLFRSSSFSLRRVLYPGRRQSRAGVKFALAWPLHLYRYIQARGSSADSSAARTTVAPPRPPLAPEPTGLTSPGPIPDPAAGGIEIKRYGLIEEDDG